MNRADYCDYHRGPSGTAVPVHRIERPSGPPVIRYACQPCREQRHLSTLHGWPEAPRERAG